jgi:hypothetical protein
MPKKIALRATKPTPITTVRVAGYSVDGSAPILITHGTTDGRCSLRIEGPGPGEFAFLTLHPSAFAALGVFFGLSPDEGESA